MDQTMATGQDMDYGHRHGMVIHTIMVLIVIIGIAHGIDACTILFIGIIIMHMILIFINYIYI